MENQVSRRTVMGAAWATPVVLFAVGAPAQAASAEDISVVWAPSAVSFGQQAVVQVTVPPGSSYIGASGISLSVTYTGAPAYVHAVSAPWPAFFPEPIPFQSFNAAGTLTAGVYTFIVSFSQYNAEFPTTAFVAQVYQSTTSISMEASVSVSAT
jgi:hypothetical protein